MRESAGRRISGTADGMEVEVREHGAHGPAFDDVTLLGNAQERFAVSVRRDAEAASSGHSISRPCGSAGGPTFSSRTGQSVPESRRGSNPSVPSNSVAARVTMPRALWA